MSINIEARECRSWAGPGRAWGACGRVLAGAVWRRSRQRQHPESAHLGRDSLDNLLGGLHCCVCVQYVDRMRQTPPDGSLNAIDGVFKKFREVCTMA